MGALDGTVTVPVVGTVPKKYLAAAAGAVAVIAGVAYYRRAQGGGAAADQPSYYADLRTGSSTGSDEYQNPAPGGTGGTGAYDSTPRPVTTDQEWTQRVSEQLSYLEPSYLLGVLGKYLDRKPLTADEAATVRSAWATAGHPPSGQQIIATATGSTPGTTPAPATDKPKPAPAPKVAYHTVRVTRTGPASTLLGIAQAHHRSTASILAEPKNAGVRGQKSLRPGQIVYVRV